MQADLADRDFTAERYQPIVIGSTAHSALSAEQSAAERAQAEARAGDGCTAHVGLQVWFVAAVL